MSSQNNFDTIQVWRIEMSCHFFPKMVLLKCSKILFWKSWCQSKPWWSLGLGNCSKCMVQKSLCQVQDPQQLSKLFSSVWHSARHFTAASAKIKGSMAGIAKKEWMVTTTPIQPHGKMSLGFGDAFGLKTWKCVCCLGFCLFLSVCCRWFHCWVRPNQETLPKRIPKKLQGGKNQVMINPRLS